MTYRPDIDGLRALAVLVVLLFHAGVATLGGGFVGVDVFFVISGYVIGNGIVADVAAGRFTVAGFYERRIRRILPVLVATLLACALLARLLLEPEARVDFARSVAASAGFVSNLYFWKSSGYFDVAAQTRPLLHTWSLAVEEQFYLFIPLTLPLALRVSRRFAGWAVLAGLAASLALSIGLTATAPTTSFYLLPTRAWELLAGTVLVFLKPTPARPLREGMAVLGLGLIVWAVLAYDEATPFPGLGALPPCLGAALLIQSGRTPEAGPTAIGRLLGMKPCVAIGLISYSLYMVHWPVIVFTRYALLRDPAGLEILGVVAVSGALATASWRWIETPLRHPANRLPQARLFARTLAILAAFMAFGLASARWNGRESGGTQARLGALERDAWMGGRCFLENQPAAAWAGDACWRTTGAGGRALLWGDSFAAHYVPGLVANAKDLSHDVLQYTFAGCPPVLAYASNAKPGCRDFNARVVAVVRAYRIDTVVLAARWDLVPARLLDTLPDTIARLKAEGVAVVVIGASPVFAFDVAVLAARNAGLRPDGSAAWYAKAGHPGTATLAHLSAGARFVDPRATACDGPLCRYRADNVDLFIDYGHLSAAGSDRAVRGYFPLMR
ncbi:acyltransferase [Methylobacterium sp. BTF04]|uniref:acyltransferase family protein n=1 Tax=Methylobacterium sp. BTF04 TaxID=2708300 RepID=UPI0013D591F6|nr:acyltransferase family protein [Methylobacterium sp. BTF04]NEU11269.1 acyltransferase [Methylobacterium sp. BTF04]